MGTHVWGTCVYMLKMWGTCDAIHLCAAGSCLEGEQEKGGVEGAGERRNAWRPLAWGQTMQYGCGGLQIGGGRGGQGGAEHSLACDWGACGAVQSCICLGGGRERRGQGD